LHSALQVYNADKTYNLQFYVNYVVINSFTDI